MAFYDQGWQPGPARQASWEQPAPPSRSGASSTSQREETSAFATQFEEVDRAVDNLVKSGKFYPGGFRRESGPPNYSSNLGGGRQYEYGQRFHGNRHSVSEFDPTRSGSGANMQNFYASQRYQGRQQEGDPMMQVKRRMAAQRERELRNYHQEQQYNRSVLAEMASNKSERSGSPSTLSEEGRRDLIARQHRALYGSESGGFTSPQAPFSEGEQPGNVSSAVAGGVRGSSPRGVDPFGAPGQVDQSASAGDRKATSPTTQQSGGKAPTPPAGEDAGHVRQLSKSTTAPLGGGMAPIGSRPLNPQGPVPGLSKRTTSPLPSSLGYGFGAADQGNERSGSSNSNANNPKENSSSMGTWGTGSGVWGSNKIGATSVWG